jgi:large subunit ribosomal protein L31e
MERIYTIPLRRGWLKKPRAHRCPRAIRDIRAFIARHTKAESISLSKAVNEAIWAHGIKKPPSKIKVKVLVENGRAVVSLPDEKENEKVQTGTAVQSEPAKKSG